MSIFTFALCEDCFDSFEEMGIIYHIFIDLVLTYIKDGKPISIKLCPCHIQKSTLQIIHEMERRNYINYIEISPFESLIVPRGVHIEKNEIIDYFICICKE